MSLQGLISGSLISYPADGTKFYGAKAGTYKISFDSGTVSGPSGGSKAMSNTLKGIEANFVRSVFVWVSDIRAKISIGGNILPSLQQPNFIIQGILFQEMTIEFPDSMIPVDDFAFQVIASDKDIFPLNISNLVGSFTPDTYSGNTGDAYATVKDIYALGYGNIVFQTFNLDGANALDVQVESSEDGVNWAPEQGYPVTPLAAGDSDIFSDGVKHAYYRIQVKSHAAGTPAAYLIAITLVR